MLDGGTIKRSKLDSNDQMSIWAFQDAKDRFSAVVNAAIEGTPQKVTRRGKPAVVVIASEAYERLLHLAKVGKARPPSFSEALLAMPQDDGEFERIQVNRAAHDDAF